MFILISYDIVDDKKRTKLAHKLKDFGPRVQKSVFEADVNESELERLRQLLKTTELDKGESIRLYRLCGECKKNISLWGDGEVTEDRDYYIV